MRIITKELALKIVKKLEAALAKTRGAHDIYVVKQDGKIVASFGIRRSSDKEIGHDHIPAQIYVGPHDALLLAQCPMSRQQWVDKLKQKGLIN
jgi:hypothetical protein